MRVATTLLRIALGLLFFYAAFDKIAEPDAFAKVVHNYQILPDVLVNAAALFLPWLEVVCGACLVVGLMPKGASLTICLLLAVFLAAMGYAWQKGIDTQCGCFGSSHKEEAITGATLLRDAGILAAALFVTVDAFWRRDAA